MQTALFILSTLIASWLGMQLVHESGHVLGAYLTGGSVERVVLHPLELSRTDLESNPRPLAVAWAGPVIGSAVPLAAWCVAAPLRMRLAYLARFFSAFCLVANGTYIGVGAFANIGDPAMMMLFGSPRWVLLAFASVTAPAGLWLWHGEGRHFGIGPEPEPVSRTDTLGMWLLCIVLMTLGWLTGRG